MDLTAQIITLIILLFLSGFFSGSEVALVSLTLARVRHMVDSKKLSSRFIQKLKDNPERMLATILIGNNIVNIGASAMMTSIIIDIFNNYAVAIATGIMTLLILIFGEITPKSLATRNNATISQLTAPIIWYLSIILAPILYILEKMLKLIGIKQKEEPSVTEEEIISMAKVAKEEGSIKDIESKFIHRIFKFDDINASEIATPRTDMVMISSKSTIQDAIKLMQKKKYSRMPVYGKSKDTIVGIVYAKDLIKHIGKKMSITKVMKKAYFVPEQKKIGSLLRQFQRKKEQMAIIVDEHGLVTGLITLEDILEEIVGEIMDETEKFDPNIKKLKKSYIVDGKTDIEEVNEKLRMRLKTADDYDTFGGFILNLTQKIPKEGDEITYRDFKLTIQETDGQRISKVKVEKI